MARVGGRVRVEKSRGWAEMLGKGKEARRGETTAREAAGGKSAGDDGEEVEAEVWSEELGLKLGKAKSVKATWGLGGWLVAGG